MSELSTITRLDLAWALGQHLLDAAWTLFHWAPRGEIVDRPVRRAPYKEWSDKLNIVQCVRRPDRLDN